MFAMAQDGRNSYSLRDQKVAKHTRRPARAGKAKIDVEQSFDAVVRILLLDPRPLTAAAVQQFLEAATGPDDLPRFEVTAVSEASGVPTDRAFDLLLLHVSPAADVTVAIEQCLCGLPAAHRKVPPVVFSDNGSPADIAAAIRGGARGYLPSSLDGKKIVAALRLLATGLAIVPPAAIAHLVCGSNPSASSQIGSSKAAGLPFTTREREILRRLHDGKPNKSIARELGLSQSTVKVHVRSVFRKLGVHNRTEAALAAGQILPNGTCET
jgi:two-component system nitrate/nitrite response regulator NarL